MTIDTGVVQQSGVIPFRLREGAPEILLVTARKSRLWSLPKGGIEVGMTPQESAENEAWEEAGIEGRVGNAALDVYTYSKCGTPIEVTFYPMLVLRELESWLEQHQRQRRWCSPGQAMLLLEPRKMTGLIEALLKWLANPAQIQEILAQD